MAFHYKSAWLSLITTLAVFIPYFAVVFRYPLAFPGLLVGAVIVQVILLVVFHTVNALVTASIRRRGDAPEHDEMERQIDLQAARISGMILSVIIAVWCSVAAFGVLFLLRDGATGTGLVIPALTALTAIHTLFSGFVLSNLIYYAAIILGYRRLTHGRDS